jgi:hypothetical protein
MILRDSLLLKAIGVAMGIPFAILMGRALTSSLHGVKPLDTGTNLLAVTSGAGVALAASPLPACRAASGVAEALVQSREERLIEQSLRH